MIKSPFGRAAKKVQNAVYGKPKVQGENKCPYCDCCFFSMVDWRAHRELHRMGWIKTKNGNGEKIRKWEAPGLVVEMNQQGSFSRGGYRFYTYADSDYIFRKRELNRY